MNRDIEYTLAFNDKEIDNNLDTIKSGEKVIFQFDNNRWFLHAINKKREYITKEITNKSHISHLNKHISNYCIIEILDGKQIIFYLAPPGHTHSIMISIARDNGAKILPQLSELISNICSEFNLSIDKYDQLYTQINSSLDIKTIKNWPREPSEHAKKLSELYTASKNLKSKVQTLHSNRAAYNTIMSGREKKPDKITAEEHLQNLQTQAIEVCDNLINLCGNAEELKTPIPPKNRDNYMRRRYTGLAYIYENLIELLGKTNYGGKRFYLFIEKIDTFNGIRDIDTDPRTIKKILERAINDLPNYKKNQMEQEKKFIKLLNPQS